VVAGIADHLCPWQSCYRTTQLLGGTVRFVLSTSGHIAAMVNPPSNPKADLPDRPGLPPGHGQSGRPADLASSWPRPDGGAGQLVAGLLGLARRAQRRAQRKSPRTLGRKGYPVRGAAPGSYVYDR
jgi:polyhydroxyalkanoate synthase